MPSIFSAIDRTLRPQGTLFYGWWIAFAGAGIHMLSSLLWMQSYGAYVVLLQAEFDWSKAMVAGAFALTRVESGVLGPLQGWLVDRFGPRLVLQVGIVIFAIGFMLFSQVQGLVGFYASFALIAIGSSVGGFQTVMVAIVSWFSRHRSKAVAFSQLGFSIGGLAVPLVVLVLQHLGWRMTAFLSGLVVLAVGIPIARLVRHRPEAYGEVPDGVPEPADARHTARGGARRVDLTAREALRTRAFWLISTGHALALLTVSVLMVHLIVHLTEGPLAFSLTAAGAVVALMTSVQVVGLVLGGLLGDRASKRWLCAACLVGHASGLALVAHASAVWMVVLGVCLHGLGWGVRGPLMASMRADYFGVRSFGTIMGFSSLIVMFGMSCGPIFAGYLADIGGGDYRLGFSIIAVASLLGALCFALATPPAPRED